MHDHSELQCPRRLGTVGLVFFVGFGFDNFGPNFSLLCKYEFALALVMSSVTDATPGSSY